MSQKSKINPKFKPFARPYRYKIASGGRGCVHGDTLLDTPNGKVKISEFTGGLVYCYHLGDVIVAKAPASMRFDIVDLFEVSLENGNSVIVTDEHKFLSNKGWEETKNLIVGDLVACAEDGNLNEPSKIVSIDYHSKDYYWDLHVPLFNNYFANGMVHHNSGKSWSIAQLLIEMARMATLRVLCARELQTSISDSVIQLLDDTIHRLGYQKEFMILKNSIVHANGSRFLFYGIKNNITKIKSLEGIDICWIEEAENVSDESWNVLIPTIRKPNSEIWLSFNPKNYLDPTYQRFIVNPPANSCILEVNWSDNEHFPQVLFDEMMELKERDYDLYLHIWEGKPLADSAKAVIKYQWIEAAIDLHKSIPPLLDGDKQLGVDVADEGGDKNAIAEVIGATLFGIKEFPEGDTSETAIKAWNMAYEHQCHTIVYDSIGVGAGVKAKFNELIDTHAYPYSMNVVGFNASGEVENPYHEFMIGKTNRAMFANLKAQAWWRLRERFQNTYLFVKEGRECGFDEMISIDSSSFTPKTLEELKSELSTPLLDYDNNGKVKVESKRDLRKRGIKSPNKADAVVMAFYRSQRPNIGLIC